MSEMHIRRLVKLNILLWGTLIVSLVVFIAWPRNARKENGVGGAISHQELLLPVQDEEGVDLELEGIPEPEEFSRPHMLTFSSYTIEKGDMIGRIAIRTGLNEDSLISVNDIKNTRLIQIGQVIKIPNQDGIYYSVKANDTLESLAEKYNTTVAYIKIANELFSDTVPTNTSLFIPGAKLDWTSRQEINGDLFIWPTSGRVSSLYGYRMAPFAGTRMFHTGIDIAAPMGSPIKAAMAGRITQIGNDESWGNFVVVSHHSGYRTFYAHMSVVRAKAGAYVETGERIGDVGSTGLSTGPHVHFTVYKNGVTVNPLSLLRN
jgi:murein DD-endopeptidase MepM/ murein hydrolase activator NlpD